MEGTDHGLIEIIMLMSYGRLRTTTETLRTAGVADGIRTRHSQIQIYNVIAKLTDLSVEENLREKTENNLEKTLLQCHCVLIRSEMKPPRAEEPAQNR